MASRKRASSVAVTEDESPAKAAKCRELGRHPTAAPVPEFSCGSDDDHRSNAEQLASDAMAFQGMAQYSNHQ
jgi:hypothetical protein